MTIPEIVYGALAIAFLAFWIVEVHTRMGIQETLRDTQQKLNGQTNFADRRRERVEHLAAKVDLLKLDLAGRAKWAANAVVARKALEDEIERIGEQLCNVRERLAAQVARTSKCDRWLAALIDSASDLRNGL